MSSFWTHINNFFFSFKQVDMIVNSVNKSLDLDKGSLCKAIITAAGSKVAEECRRDHLLGVSEGNVVVTSAGNLKCEKLCHACVPPHEQKSNDVSVKVKSLLLYNIMIS